MKVVVISGEVYRAEGKYPVGKTFDADNDEATRLIALGVVQKAGDGEKATITPPPETAEEKAAREAAEKRAALQKRALELKVGTADEIAALPDAELAARVGAKQREMLIGKALELKVGTADEIAALPDADIKVRVEKAGGEKAKGFLNWLLGGGENK